MQLHQLKRNTPNREEKRVGRGGKRGKTSGRGTKGQKARAGHKLRPEVRDLIKKLPKLRGRGIHGLKTFRPKPSVVNVGTLNVFPNGTVVTVSELIKQGLIGDRKSKTIRVKLLGEGVLEKKLTIKGLTHSQSAKEKIEKAGGSIVS